MWIEAAWKTAVALAQARVSAQLRDSLAGNGDYAEGGAREACCSEKGLLGAACCGSDEYRAISSGAATKSRAAGASTGACRDWQMWQAVSEPFGCW